jgi:hypothetical protein
VDFYRHGVAGGNSSDQFDDAGGLLVPDLPHQRLAAIRVRHGDFIDSIQAVYMNRITGLVSD